MPCAPRLRITQVDALVLRDRLRRHDRLGGQRSTSAAATAEPLKQKWAEGPQTYLGLMSAGFPNLFIITGPGSPSVLSNMIVSIEQHVDWITDCIAYLRDRGLDTMEANRGRRGRLGGARQRGRRHHALSAGQLLVHGRQHPRQAAIFMPYIGGVGAYRQICDEVAAKGYEGFAMATAERVQKRAVS